MLLGRVLLLFFAAQQINPLPKSNEFCHCMRLCSRPGTLPNTEVQKARRFLSLNLVNQISAPWTLTLDQVTLKKKKSRRQLKVY